ncbi:helix-turn-helix domain-containing protein [Methylococcus mesophilus]|uniref:helix-turn-helix domain-containing protein n=1 Tax=Methylococcus mesophilus TaxID=2993564 RepID=UPI00224B8E4C|nr:helix-turn-helix domain-containing protein [Methylococcus mesophilus]UZR29477.1 helix-turn-helix domain-containing protein [Methylococcus mesophilus]
MKETLDTVEAAELMRVSLGKMTELARTGEVPAVMLGTHYLFLRDELLEYLRTRAKEEQRLRREMADAARRMGDQAAEKRGRGRPRRRPPIDLRAYPDPAD